jgi:eukaryotic-like serine/threonine-protein kinase
MQERAHADRLGTALANEEAAKERALEDRDRRTLLAEFLVDAFREADPSRTKAEPPSAVEILARGARRIDDQLADDPATRAALMSVIGAVYLSLGQHDESAAILRRAEPLLRESDSSRADLAELLTHLGDATHRSAEIDAAEGILREALALQVELAGDASWQAAVVRSKLGALLNEMQRFDEAELLLSAAIETLSDYPEADPILLARAHARLGGCYLTQAHLPTRGRSQTTLVRMGEQSAQSALAAFERATGGGEHLEYELAGLWSQLGLALKLLGEYEQAELYYRRAIATYAAFLGEGSLQVAGVEANLASSIEFSGRGAEAIPLLRKSFETLDRELAENHYLRVVTWGNLLGLLFRTDHLAEPERDYPELIELQRELFGEASALSAYSLSNLGMCALHAGDLEAAEALIEEAYDEARTVYGEQSSSLDHYWLTRAHLALRRGDLARSRAQLALAERASDGVRGKHIALAQVLALRARLELAEGDELAAIATLQRLAAGEGFDVVEPIRQAEGRSRLALLLAFERDPDELIAELARDRELLANRLFPSGPRFQGLLRDTIETFEELGLQARADELRAELRDG